MYDKPKHQNLPYNLKMQAFTKRFTNYSKFSSIFWANKGKC